MLSSSKAGDGSGNCGMRGSGGVSSPITNLDIMVAALVADLILFLL